MALGGRGLSSARPPFPRNARLRGRNFLWITQLLTLQARQRDGRVDPLIDEGTQARIGAHLLLHPSKFGLADELTAAAAMPGVAELVIRPVALIGIALAATARGAAHIVLA